MTPDSDPDAQPSSDPPPADQSHAVAGAPAGAESAPEQPATGEPPDAPPPSDAPKEPDADPAKAVPVPVNAVSDPTPGSAEVPVTRSDGARRGTTFRPRHSAAQRFMLAVNIVVVLGCFAAGAALLWAKGEREQFRAAPRPLLVTTTGLSTGPVETDANGDPVPSETFPAADPEARNFLVAGSDGKACVDPDSPWANAADPDRDPGERSDTIMVMRVNPETHQAAVLSFPRDLWVDIPGRSTSRINSAFVDGDYTRLQQTLYDNFGIPVDEYVQIDFCAFKSIVEAINGVSVPFEFPVFDRNTGLDITEPGCHTFMGDEALAYVRSRHLFWVDEEGEDHADESADLGRISRQQDFLRRMLRAALNRGMFNPSVARGLIETLQNYVVFSEGMSINDMLRWAGVIADLEPDDIRTYQVEADRKIISGNDVLVPRDSENMRAILDIFRGVTPIAGAPEQTLDTAATAVADPEVTTGTEPLSVTTSSVATADASPPQTATADTATVDTVAGPDSMLYGVVPPADVQCPGS